MQTVNRLSTRSNIQSRSLLPDPVRIEGSEADLDCPRLLLLVHGFANREKDAHASYESFQSILAAETSTGSGMLGCVWEFHWPGNHPGNKIMDAGSYAARIPTAAYAGFHLANFLASLGKTRYLKTRQQLFIVAHSLGCRVALEAIRIIRQDPEYMGPTIGGVFLMAAAVPASACLPDGSYQPLSGHSREDVFYSRSDKVLSRPIFGSGQRVFGEPGDAVGRNGRPVPRWSSRRETHLPHDEYWRSGYVARFIAEGLLAGPVALPEIELPVDELRSIEVTGSRETSERELGSRR